ncbi:isocitrate lyase/phosphoenolpyruvate mutase family protein [Bradyrhizobium japonicum]|uniref:isocitrate lyase/phosphoenolpyruvate mutase family protein n=1 Tax=Bradyrhizobium japonicum TaxID=375 RepID=UPI001FCDAC21|nr:isocitrate lyase/phosphoenolpyruvate mutase family protein [Bradyrhizobium japonicum]
MRDPSRFVLANGPDQSAGSSPTELLRAQVCSSNELSFLMEARDGLFAGIAECAGFRGLWASGLSTAWSLGYRNANEASLSQLVEEIERIVDSTELPVLVDGDGGFELSTIQASSPATSVDVALRASRGGHLYSEDQPACWRATRPPRY